jgi:hypothetical protein
MCGNCGDCGVTREQLKAKTINHFATDAVLESFKHYRINFFNYGTIKEYERIIVDFD